MHIIVLNYVCITSQKKKNYVCICIYDQSVIYFVHNQSQAHEKERVITLRLRTA